MMVSDSIEYKACQQVLESLAEGVCVVDRGARIAYWNAAAERITGCARDEMIGCAYPRGLPARVDEEGDGLPFEQWPVEATLRDGQPHDAELHIVHKAGYRVPVRVRAAPILSPDGTVCAAVEIISDTSELARLAAQLHDLEQRVLIDSLTGTANRQCLETHLRRCMAERDRYGWPFGVIFLDIDQFKQVNDQFGHEAGDRVLKHLSHQLSSRLRSFDILGRWGGDEFLAVCRNVDEESVQKLAERERAQVEHARPTVHQQPVVLTASVGATMPRSDESLDTILRRVDRLMYMSKHAGGNRVCFGI